MAPASRLRAQLTPATTPKQRRLIFNFLTPAEPPEFDDASAAAAAATPAYCQGPQAVDVAQHHVQQQQQQQQQPSVEKRVDLVGVIGGAEISTSDFYSDQSQ